ncbi:DUF2520 domain-containing protein [Alicyclobacillus sp.]|uniref:Rossmann-like and DUF2520 domain-containing protein n=1 Tax=Alicyclobacillus sp. TaxID=61169 RepID=UPI0025C195EB|nr:DUF2520 domain-containing protein [Alicyclobacillus sp.]MCL6516287.1 DUF2520 domain-containing protein [Alicyclobacillus sp.]
MKHVVERMVFIGPGKMATALTVALQEAGYPVLGAYSRDPNGDAAARYASVTKRCVRPMTEIVDLYACEDARSAGGLPAAETWLSEADVIWLTVPDGRVAEIAQALAVSGQLRAGQLVVHVSGALPSGVLSPVRAAGAACLSLHPLQSVADPPNAAAPSSRWRPLRGVYCALEGDATAIQAGRRWVRDWEGHSVEISAMDKPRYHAAAALAANGLVALVDAAARLLPFPNGVAALLPLLDGVLRNLERVGLPNALTGPVERGDLETVRAHLAALRGEADVDRMYRALSTWMIHMAQDKGRLTDDAARQLRGLLDTPEDR